MGTQDVVQMGLGGARRDRTADLLHAMQALSQLSYSPTKSRALYGSVPSLSRIRGGCCQALKLSGFGAFQAVDVVQRPIQPDQGFFAPQQLQRDIDRR